MSSLLPPELFDKIISFLDCDVRALYCCALVSRAFHISATALLYKRIHLSPPRAGLAWQEVEDTLGRKPFAASRLPSHCGFVREFLLDGYITRINASRRVPTPIIDRIPEAMRLWVNLNVVTLVPKKSTKAALLKIVDTLRDCSSLRTVVVNELVMEEEIMPYLAEVTKLESLTLVNPTRALFLELRGWLQKNQGSLQELKMIGDCGSLTPGILRMVIPYILNIRTLGIGLSYSLANADVFPCLSQLPNLQNLSLRYYPQHKALPPVPPLRSLKCLTVLHTTLYRKEDAKALSAWIRRLTSSSPLESLETISSGELGPKLCFDGLVCHIASNHHTMLRELRMPTAYVRGPALRLLLQKCSFLCHISLTVAFSTLQALPIMVTGLSHLRTVSLDICDRQELVLEKKDALKLMERVPQLECITVRNVTWKRTYVPQLNEEGNVTPEFFVSLIANTTLDES